MRVIFFALGSLESGPARLMTRAINNGPNRAVGSAANPWRKMAEPCTSHGPPPNIFGMFNCSCLVGGWHILNARQLQALPRRVLGGRQNLA